MQWREYSRDRIRARESNALIGLRYGRRLPTATDAHRECPRFPESGRCLRSRLCFRVESGKPSLALRAATKDFIQLKQLENAVVVTVRPTTYPGPDCRFTPTAKPKEYRFP